VGPENILGTDCDMRLCIDKLPTGLVFKELLQILTWVTYFAPDVYSVLFSEAGLGEIQKILLESIHQVTSAAHSRSVRTGLHDRFSADFVVRNEEDASYSETILHLNIFSCWELTKYS